MFDTIVIVVLSQARPYQISSHPKITLITSQDHKWPPFKHSSLKRNPTMAVNNIYILFTIHARITFAAAVHRILLTDVLRTL